MRPFFVYPVVPSSATAMTQAVMKLAARTRRVLKILCRIVGTCQRVQGESIGLSAYSREAAAYRLRVKT
jgi:hypothetical protein